MLRLAFLLCLLSMMVACSHQTISPSQAENAAHTRYMALNRLVRGDAASAFDLRADSDSLLRDPTFACRHPALAWELTHTLSLQRSPEPCEQAFPFLVYDTHWGYRLTYLAPQRVREIQVLFASQGAQAASRFGHIALRLVVCKTAVDADGDCAENLREHVVLGFLAYVDDAELSMLKGVSGGYDAHLMASSFMTAFRSNTLLEDRDLTALPLKLTAEQRRRWLAILAEVHWSFHRAYRFFSDNCATLLSELFTVLTADLPAAPPDLTARLNTLRPDRLFAALRESPWASAQVLDDLAEAERRGYFFPSNRDYYAQALTTLTRRDPSAGLPETLGDYQSMPGPERLLLVLESERLRDAIILDPRARDAVILLEELTLMSQQHAMRVWLLALFAEYEDDLAQHLLSAEIHAEARAVVQRCVLGPLTRARQGRPVFNGIPYASLEEVAVQAGAPQCTDQRTQTHLRTVLRDWLRGYPELADAFVARQRQVTRTHENLMYLRHTQK